MTSLQRPYKPPGVILADSNYYIKPIINDSEPDFDFLKLTIIVKELELISEEGEITISGTSLDTKRTIKLVEGDNIVFGVNPITNQITIDTRTKGDPGLVGTKLVNETTIGHGKVLSYDQFSGKLVYIDITQMVEDVVNAVLDEVVTSAINDAMTNVMNNVIPSVVANSINAIAPNLIDAKIDEELPTAVSDKINEVLPSAIDTKVNEVVPSIVDSKINEALPLAVANEIESSLPQAVESKVNELLPDMVSSEVNLIVPNVVDTQINNVLPSAIQEALNARVKEQLVSKEVLVESADGLTSVFSLMSTPIEGSEHIYMNGVLQETGEQDDYTISGSEITFTSPPPANAKIIASYKVLYDPNVPA